MATKTQALSTETFDILDSITIADKIEQFVDFVNRRIQPLKPKITIVTDEENFETLDPQEAKELIKKSQESLNVIVILFQHGSSQIAVTSNYEENETHLILMLSTKEKNKNALTEISNFLNLKSLLVNNNNKMNKNELITNPIFNERNFKLKHGNCFVVMPFSEPWSDRVYKKLKSILISQKITVVRADNLFGQNVLEDIWIAINESSFIIADTTNKNPNVFYEIGIAHTLGKNVILITQDIEDIPFDFRLFRHVAYEDNVDGFNTLEQKLIQSIKAL
jgi:hypothetical protein